MIYKITFILLNVYHGIFLGKFKGLNLAYKILRNLFLVLSEVWGFILKSRICCICTVFIIYCFKWNWIWFLKWWFAINQMKLSEFVNNVGMNEKCFFIWFWPFFEKNSHRLSKIFSCAPLNLLIETLLKQPYDCIWSDVFSTKNKVKIGRNSKTLTS